MSKPKTPFLQQEYADAEKLLVRTTVDIARAIAEARQQGYQAGLAQAETALYMGEDALYRLLRMQP
jgi:hypothetical protein